MKINLLLLSLSLACSSAFSQLSSVITCWEQNTINTGFAGELTNVQEVNYSATYVYVKTKDIPSWIPVGYNWPNNPWFAVAMNYQFRIRRNPTPNVGPETETGYGHIGLWKNGCSIYNPKDAKSYQDSSVWFQNAWYWEHLAGETFDPCIGHPNGSGEYHTHVSPACLYDITDSTQVSPLIGYAFDSYPIYGGYGYTNPLDTNSAVKRLKSSYRLRNITDRTVLPDGTILSPIHYGPSLTAVPLGAYMEDYEFISGLGDLDEHNGRYCITREYPNGIYAYFTTLDWVADVFGYGIIPVFPYVLGKSYYGEVYPTDGNTGPNSGFVMISEPVTLYNPSTLINEINEKIKIEMFPNPTAGNLFLKFSVIDNSKIYTGIIYNNSGQIIEQAYLSPGKVYFYDVSGLPNGIYYFRIVGDVYSSHESFVVSK